MWLDVALDQGATVPAELVHAVGVSMAQPQPPLFPATMTENVAPVTVQTRKPAVIAPPLVGPNWVDANSCCDMTPHRMALNPLNGQLWAAERFAIDYVQLLPDGRLFNGDKTKPESYPGFGADIHAVADGPRRRGSRRTARAGSRKEPERSAARPVRGQSHRCRTSATATTRSTPTSKPAASKSRWVTG